LKFFGFQENRFENVESLVLEFLHDAGFQMSELTIERAHRLGPYVPGRTRPVIVKFWHFKERERVWQQLGARSNPSSYRKVYITEDYPESIEAARKKLLPVFQAALRYRDPVTKQPLKVRMAVDKLYINNQRFTVDNLHSLPSALQPASIYTPHNAEMVAFFTSNSPLSNHHPAPFKVNGEQFNCGEQFIMTQKARLFNDQDAVKKISKELIPAKQKSIGKSIKGFSRQVWEAQAPELITPGLVEKFLQNKSCRDMLLNTGDKRIVEATKDNFWGAGVPLFSKHIWIKERCTGKNVMGKILQAVRLKVKSHQSKYP
jgi:hypothetical protein